MAIQDDLLAALARHIGRENGIGAAELARELGIPERRLRRLISAAIEGGAGIVGRPETGYYIPRTAEDVAEKIDLHRSRARHELRMASRLRKLVLPDLTGQMKLKT